MKSLQDKVAIITGASRGIGQSIAVEFAKQGAKLVLSASSIENLSGTLRDFKKYTSHLITKMLSEETSEKSALLFEGFKEAAKKHSRNKKYQVWQQHNHPEEVYSPKFTLSKIRYIHNNPVEAGLVDFPEQYGFSSAVDYAGGKGKVQVTLINLHNLYK